MKKTCIQKISLTSLLFLLCITGDNAFAWHRDGGSWGAGLTGFAVGTAVGASAASASRRDRSDRYYLEDRAADAENRARAAKAELAAIKNSGRYNYEETEN